MSIMTIETTITRKYLFGKSKSDLAYMYLELLERAVQAEAERDAAQGALEFAQRYWMDAIAERDEANKRAKEYVDVFKRVNAAKRVWRKRAEQAEADARALANIARRLRHDRRNAQEAELIAKYLDGVK